MPRARESVRLGAAQDRHSNSPLLERAVQRTHWFLLVPNWLIVIYQKNNPGLSSSAFFVIASRGRLIHIWA
jgi:hypothetical protein